MPDLVPFAVSGHGALIRGVRGGNGPTALLLHGTAGSWRNFRPWVPVLVPRLHLIIPDLPGFGESPVPSRRPGLLAWADLLRGMLCELDAKPDVLVGLGMGASLAMAHLKVGLHPAAGPHLTHLVLHTPASYPGALRPAFRWAMRFVAAPVTFKVARRVLESAAFRRWYIHTLVEGPGILPEDARVLREDFERASIPVLRGILRDMVTTDFRPVLRATTVPTLLMVSEDDPFVYPREVHALADSMPDARVAVQQGVAHGWTDDVVMQHQRWLAEFLDAPLSSRSR